MNKAPLLEELLKYHKEENLILSMPGNKSGKAFLRDSLGKKFKENLGALDITEVDPLDNLHCPEGVIKEAEELLAKTYNVRKAYFLVNGSSSGNLASIFAAFKEGDEVLVERNCHKSIYNGLILRKLKVIYIDAVIDEDIGVFMPPREKEINEALSKAVNPKGIIITSPNYFGISYDIEKKINELKEKGIKVIIDSAHGAHFGVNKDLPKSLASLGDYVVLSAHKTLPSLTQGAYLLVNNNEENIDFYVKTFMTTSPSYLIMASLDYARYYLDNYGKDDYGNLIERAEKWKEKINLLGKVRVINDENLFYKYAIDKSRYLIILNKGYSGHKLLDYLRVNKIQAEMSFSRGVVLIFSPSNTEEDFEKLYLSIKNLNINVLKTNEKNAVLSKVSPVKVLEPYEVFNLNSTSLDINDVLGKIAKEAIVPYPPGIPLICAGEKITKEAIDIIKEYIENSLKVIGVQDNFIRVIEM
ncbi:aminotransferase class I/II-fold pyridoxal phosphate-dependent enzyme [Clostridium sp.]|uniref:aminotransferase class I/II-fold pyridoxal phosphate-dependent enzyme n=1 Tax=Clostridium sp. TaxID=1506 RepID=UPI0025BD0218|nr:aminotransferase class I/II-fold pyridoxal phosphate-dependent enzyme [Clostridium sp.]